MYNRLKSQLQEFFNGSHVQRENLQIVKNFIFETLISIFLNLLCKILGENQHCYLTHQSDVRKNSNPFRIRMEPDAILQTQEPNEVLRLYGDKLNVLLDVL